MRKKSIKKRRWRDFYAIVVLFLIVGCGSNDITSIDDIVFPATNVSFRQHVQPLFTISCNSQGCHDAARFENNDVDLTSFAGVRSTNVALPFDTACGLVRVIYGRELHQGPINILYNHREGLKQWVLEGAQDN